MALVSSSPLTDETTRLSQCRNAFDVLMLKPSQLITDDTIHQAHKARLEIVRSFMRHPQFPVVKGRLDEAKVLLLVETSRQKEAEKYHAAAAKQTVGLVALGDKGVQLPEVEKRDLDQIDRRTRLLEAKAAQLLLV